MENPCFVFLFQYISVVRLQGGHYFLGLINKTPFWDLRIQESSDLACQRCIAIAPPLDHRLCSGFTYALPSYSVLPPLTRLGGGSGGQYFVNLKLALLQLIHRDLDFGHNIAERADTGRKLPKKLFATIGLCPFVMNWWCALTRLASVCHGLKIENSCSRVSNWREQCDYLPLFRGTNWYKLIYCTVFLEV